MENFLKIVSLPDNIPIIIMIVSIAYLTWIAFSEARKNDKLIEEGKKDQVYRRMVE
jgi:threonine/homoserine/homoserine lactone efflux protein